MADLLNTATSPDFDRVQLGDLSATRDGMALIWQVLQAEIQFRRAIERKLAPSQVNDWIAMARSLKGPADAGLLSSNRLITHSIRMHLSADQTIATGTATKIQFDVASLDNYSECDVTTNYRLTPKVEGIWIVFTMGAVKSLSGRMLIQLRNGGAGNSQSISFAAASDVGAVSIDIVAVNGSTDYLEGFVEHNHGSDRFLAGGSDDTYMVASHLGLAN